jgi:hypothetical protein
MRACFFFGAMVWTGFQLPAFLRLPFGVLTRVYSGATSVYSGCNPGAL